MAGRPAPSFLLRKRLTKPDGPSRKGKMTTEEKKKSFRNKVGKTEIANELDQRCLNVP